MIINRVLTLDEVLALKNGKRVWVEHNPSCNSVDWPDEVHVVHMRGSTLVLCGGSGFTWLPKSDGDWFGTHYRVWSLRRPPTVAKLAANPWGGAPQ